MSSTAPVTMVILVGYAVAFGISATIAAYCFLLRHNRVSYAFGTAMVALSVWSVGAFLRLLAPTKASWYTWTVLMYLGVVSTAALFFVFAVQYTGWGIYLSRTRVAALFVVPAASIVVLATDPGHSLFYTSVYAVPFGTDMVFTADSGTWFWIHALYSYLLFGIATGLLAMFALRNHHVYRLQALSVLVGAAIPWIVNVVYVFSLGVRFPVDPTPVGFAAGSGLLAYAVFGARLTDLTPVARSAVVDAMDDAVFVLDSESRVVDLNPAARTLLDGDGTNAIGTTIGTLLPERFVSLTDPKPTSVEWNDRWFRTRELPLAGDSSVLLVSDLTDEKRTHRQLRQQNRRLEEFTRVAAHDLRNPLNAITGYTQLARETGNTDHLEQVGPSARRIEALIDDLLTLGREGRAVEETEPVSLAAAAETAWEAVDAVDATLETADDVTVHADETRFVLLLKNLFTNAVSYGGSPVRVRVGATSNGFYVADDGTGIPTERRADVFEYGYSTHETTGLGLPLVRSIAVAHGWEVSVADASDGGARFEFCDVRTGSPTRSDAVEGPESSTSAP